MNYQDFSFYSKIISSSFVVKILFLSFMCDRHFAIADHFNCTILLFWKWIKKSCVLCRNFISIYKINRTLHGRLGIRILSSSAESIFHEWEKWMTERYFQHEKIKFVSLQSNVISSIYTCMSLHWIVFTYFCKKQKPSNTDCPNKLHSNKFQWTNSQDL